jgi:ribosomal protein S18 acetylase RimI-like enzyme
MIEKLKNNDLEIAKKIRAVFQVSYKIEAKLLNASDFPPLKRPLENYIGSKNDFYGYLRNNELAAVVEIHKTKNHTLIRSLVVDPYFFRQGIAGKLVQFVFDTYHTKLFIVETGVANGPATALYRKFGFIETMQWDTDYGIRKVKFEKKMGN